MGFDVRCEKCGKRLQWNMVVEDLWTCPSCKGEKHQTHPTCSHPSCAEWANDDTGLCGYHERSTGKHDGPTTCTVQGCDSPVVGNGRCIGHVNDEALQEARDNPPDPPEPGHTRNPHFPKSTPEERQRRANTSGMGRGEYKGRHEDYEQCRNCGTPKVATEEDPQPECPNKSDHKKPEKRRPEWPSGYPAAHAEADEGITEEPMPVDEQPQDDGPYEQQQYEDEQYGTLW